jgi:hypothetical protein
MNSSHSGEVHVLVAVSNHLEEENEEEGKEEGIKEEEVVERLRTAFHKVSSFRRR